METRDYQFNARRTINEKTKDQNYAILNGALGLCGEAGEVADIVKKSIFQGHHLDTEKIADELGDVLWYISLLCDGIGYTMHDVMQKNVLKLQKRYPSGFSEEKSVHREE